MFFQVKTKSGPIWQISPNKELTLNDLSTIKYGEVPSSCHQTTPENSAAPPAFIEGDEYYAFAAIYDSSAIGVRFTIKDRKVVELSKKHW
jgi:hypothetical protein